MLKSRADQKLALLEKMRDSLLGERRSSLDAAALREILIAKSSTAQHGLDLLEAFRRDVTKSRYADWDDLMDYCRYSANPVGRFVLDVHGELRGLWPVRMRSVPHCRSSIICRIARRTIRHSTAFIFRSMRCDVRAEASVLLNEILRQRCAACWTS